MPLWILACALGEPPSSTAEGPEGQPAVPSPIDLIPAPVPPRDAVPAASVDADRDLRFTLVGRASHQGLLTPALADGAAILGADCATVNAELRGHGPPCLAERWRGGGVDVLFRVANPAAALTSADGLVVEARTTWSTLGVGLSACLEDPLMVPPARDPGGTRTLVARGAEAWWELRLTGQNRCGLGGRLLLLGTADRGDWAELTVNGAPWDQGGRERLSGAVTR
jgi:hypothetical protein